MLTSSYTNGDISVTIEREVVDVTSERPTPNERWTHTDRQGHEHRYEPGYPSLDYIIDERHWCDGTEGVYSHDPHWAVDAAHYECKLCREVIEPAMDPPFTPKMMPGLITLTIEGTRSDGVWVRAIPRSEDSEAITEAVKRGDDLQPLLDALDDESIVELRYASH